MSFHSVESLLSEDQLLFNQFGRGPKVDIPFNLVHQAFEYNVDNYPDTIAARRHDGKSICYRELDAWANVLGNKLIDHGLRPGDRVCIVVSRSLEMLAGLLAVLKAGGQYIPLDGGIVSEDSLRHILKDTGAKIVLCLGKFRSKVDQFLPTPYVRVLELDTDKNLWVGDERRPNVNIDGSYGCYVIYTSGTTGKPKGVDVRHRNVTNVLLVGPAKLGIKPGKNVSQVLNISFDMAAWEILGCLMNGGTLHIRNGDWKACLSRVDTVIATPSVLGKFRQADFPNITTIAVGGEPCPVALADEWSRHNNTFYNICGPTEITILNTAHLHRPEARLTIGRPNPNNNVYILDDAENPVKIGKVGLMWAGGPSVTAGYLNLPELTATRFKPDKFTQDGSMMFNTGDLGRWTEDGELIHLGRKDDQIKIKGFRVELDGVSAVIEKVPTVTKGCALKIDDELCGFYSAPSRIDDVEIAKLVSHELPYYAVPSRWIYLATVPLTANGKFDKRKLQEIAEDVESPPISPVSEKTMVSRGSTVTLAQSISAGDLEKGFSNVLTEAEVELDEDKESAKYDLPAKNGFHGQRWLRHRFFSLYRRFFSVVFLVNVAFVVLVAFWNWDRGTLPIPDLATAVAANLLVAVAMRQDHVINFLFWLATRVPTWMPIAIRRQCARVYHIGGIHSGAAISATMWWMVFTAAATYNFITGNEEFPINLITVVISGIVVLLLLAMVIMAHPDIRIKLHDQFEWTHRFAGWTATALVWVHLIVTTDSLRSPDTPLGAALLQTPAVWLLALITFSIALPWMCLRKVTVRPEYLSKHAIRLHFDFTTPIAGKAIRITDRPLVEWHAFATIDKPSVKGFSVIVSNAGDWTKKTIEGKPTTLWTRGVLASGVLTIAPLFKKVVLVATGSGIGPCLPVLLEGRVPARVLWSTPHPLETFGKEIMDNVLEADPKAVIWNTRTQGKPDLAALAYQMYRESDCEAVCIISNKKVTQQFVYRMESRGVPAFGAIFDS